MLDDLLNAQALSAWYGKAQILFELDLNVAGGECVALMGRNGAGKSTTMKALMGLVALRSGRVQFRGHEVAHWPTHRTARAGLGWVPEDRRIFTELTVRENLTVARQPRREGAPFWDEAAVFELFPNLAGMATRSAARMSGGEQQMLTIARTLMGQPYLLLLDEPSEGVAPLIVEQMAHTINRLKAQGLGVLLSEQNIHFARLVSERAVVLEKGELRWAGTMAGLMEDDAVQRTYLSL